METVFGQPWWLIVLVLPLVVLPALYIWAWRHPRGETMGWANQMALSAVLVKVRAPSRHSAAALILIAMAVCGAGLARPVLNTSVPEERASMCLLVDVSKSMDVEGRMQQAQDGLSAAINAAPPELNLCLISFADGARLLVSPTRDKQHLLDAVSGLQTETGGTATGEAVYQAAAILADFAGFAGDAKNFPASIAILADGRENIGAGERSLDEAVTSLVELNSSQGTSWKIYGIAYGSDSARIGDCGIVCQRDYPAMQRAAEATDGEAYLAEDSATLETALRDIQQRTVAVPTVLYMPDFLAWTAGAVFVLLSIAFALLCVGDWRR